MYCPICSWSAEDAEYLFLGETKFWRAVLAPNQSLLGRCVVHLKRHAGSLKELVEEEQLEFLAVVKGVERAVEVAFGAAMFNWSCYMNHAYRERRPNPHVHWWVVPRYDHTVNFGGMTFDDPHFGEPYDHSRRLKIPNDLHAKAAAKIKASLTFPQSRMGLDKD